MSESPTTVGPRDALARFHRAMLDLSADDLADLFAVDAVYEFPFLTPGRPAGCVRIRNANGLWRATACGGPCRMAPTPPAAPRTPCVKGNLFLTH